MADNDKPSSYGLYAASEITNQADLFLTAVGKPENADARAKLEAEDLDQDEENRGKALLADASAALAGARTGPGAQTASTEVQTKTRAALVDEFSRRIKKTRAKLQEFDVNDVLLNALNKAVRKRGQSFAALSSRVEAFVEVIAEPISRPGDSAPVTIAQEINISEAQKDALRTKLDAFRRSMSDQDSKTSKAQDLTSDKDVTIGALDRWLAKWQHIAKADFTEAELTAFGVPVNINKSRRRRGKKDEDGGGSGGGDST